MQFQSTHPLGVRLTTGNLMQDILKFQSTHPLGVRQKALDKASNMTVFQSTHPLGVRPIEFATELAGGGFNPRTHSGCDL